MAQDKLTTQSDDPTSFQVGGRYANRLGEYEVLTIDGDDMLIRYDDGKEARVTRSVQARIAQNMAMAAVELSPYPKTQQDRNQSFFRSLGFLATRVLMLEAIVPPRSLAGFVKDYASVKDQKPREGQSGFYVHRPEADKWGCELRVTFQATDVEVRSLDLGPDINIVVSPDKPGQHWRINSNRLWWKLLRLGFSMGDVQDVEAIRAANPRTYRPDFESGFDAGAA